MLSSQFNRYILQQYNQYFNLSFVITRSMQSSRQLLTEALSFTLMTESSHLITSFDVDFDYLIYSNLIKMAKLQQYNDLELIEPNVITEHKSFFNLGTEDRIILLLRYQFSLSPDKLSNVLKMEKIRVISSLNVAKDNLISLDNSNLSFKQLKSNHSCPNKNLIANFVENNEQELYFKNHINRCGDCSGYFEFFTNYIKLIKEMVPSLNFHSVNSKVIRKEITRIIKQSDSQFLDKSIMSNYIVSPWERIKSKLSRSELIID